MKATVDRKVLIDELGKLRAAKADIVLKEAAIQDQLSNLDPGVHDGHLFTLRIIEESERSILDMAAVKQKLTPQWLRAHMRKVHVERQYRVEARKLSR